MRDHGECDDGAKFASMNPNVHHLMPYLHFGLHLPHFGCLEGDEVWSLDLVGVIAVALVGLHLLSAHQVVVQCMTEDLDVVTQPWFVRSSRPNTVACLNAHPDLVPEAGVINLVTVIVLNSFEIKNPDGWMVDLEISAIHRH